MSIHRNNVTQMAAMLGKSPPTLTENGALALATTGKAVVDYFFKITQDSSPETVISLLEKSWEENPLMTLKIIGYIRSCQKGCPGQGARDPSMVAYQWLHKKYYKVLKTNLPVLLQLGSWRDYSQLWKKLSHEGYTSRSILAYWAISLFTISEKIDKWLSEHDLSKKAYLQSPFHDRVPLDQVAVKAAMVYKAAVTGEAMIMSKQECLSLGQWKSLYPLPDIENIMAVKYVPPRKSGKQHPNNVIRSILRRYLNQISDSYFNETYVKPGKKLLNLVETAVCHGHHQDINYSHVSSLANVRHMNSFKHYDRERYEKYLEEVAANKASINSSRIQPHLLMEKTLHGRMDDDVANALWQGFHQYLDKEGVDLTGWFPIVDTSGSMMTCHSYDNEHNYVQLKVVPLYPALALGMIIAERNRGSYKNKFMTFDKEPQIREISGDTLKERIKSVFNPYGLNTNFVKVAEEMVSLYEKVQVTPEETIKKLVILTDMEHDDYKLTGFTEGLYSSYYAFAEVFKQAKYPVPTMVFWNMKGNNVHFPVLSQEIDVGLISGFSIDILYLLLKSGQYTPEKLVEYALSHPAFDQLTV